MDARFNREDLIRRITKIANCAARIEVTCADAVEFLREKCSDFGEKDLIYVDPPYFEKGRLLYYDAYGPDDHAAVAELLLGLKGPRWVVSYDDVGPIRSPVRVRASTRIHDRIQCAPTHARARGDVLQQGHGGAETSDAAADDGATRERDT